MSVAKGRLLIIGLREYGLTQKDLDRLGETPVVLEVHSRNSPDVYPSGARFRRLLAKRPEERREAVGRWRTRQHDRLLAVLRPREHETLYFNGDPVGVRVTLPARDVRRVLKQVSVDYVNVLKIRGMSRKRETRRTPGWFAVKARFAVQIEGQTKGMQTYEERIVLVWASSFAEAERKATREFRRYEAPFLTTSGHFRRSALETILDTYDVGDDAIDPDGTEVFSELKQRRMKSDYEWNGHESTR
jgi:hypothetical protein